MSVNIIQYFLNHRLELSEVRKQVRELYDGGLDGVCAHARHGMLTPYMSNDWWAAIDVIMEVCRETGLEFWIWDEDYFPSGRAGGRINWENPTFQATGLEFTKVSLSGSGPLEADFAAGMLLRAFALKKSADGKYEEVVDITPYCGTRRQEWRKRHIQHSAYSAMVSSAGHPHWRTAMLENRFAASWTPPQAGEYDIIGVTLARHPLLIDMFQPSAVQRFIEIGYQPYYDRYAADFGKIIKGSFTDEPNPGGFLYPWSNALTDEFRMEHGYDIADYLPHLAVDIDDRTATIRHHYRLTQHRLQEANYVGQIAKWCREHAIAMSGHLTRTEWLTLTSAWWPNQVRFYRQMDIPATDPLTGSCAWADIAYHAGLKVVSSAAHLFGKAQTSSDALAVIGDEMQIADMKYMLDYQMVLGVNHFMLHGASYSMEGPRKDEVPPSLFYQHTQWKHMKHLWNHVSQTAQALTGGRHECEIAVLYPSTSLACGLLPRHERDRNPDEAKIHQLIEAMLSNHSDFDFIDEITLQENVTSAGELVTPESYKVIVLPHLKCIDAKTCDALERFLKAGGKVMAVGTLPVALCDNLAAPRKLWEPKNVKLFEDACEEFLTQLPCVKVEGCGANDVLVLFRSKDGKRIAFAFNRGDKLFEGSIEGCNVSIPSRGSRLLKLDEKNSGQSVRKEKLAEDLSRDWEITFPQNHVPLNFWHAANINNFVYNDLPSAAPGFDLMQRQPSPITDDGAVNYYCRFMLAGEVRDMKIVTEISDVTTGQRWYVNGIAIDSWQPVGGLETYTVQADISHTLRSGSTPTLNIVKVETQNASQMITEVPYLCGSFACEYRYAHPSFPFITAQSGERKVDNLVPWNMLGYPTFSGTVIYRKTFDVKSQGIFSIDLGCVNGVAAVSIDGREAGVLPWGPYKCDLGELSSGSHTVEIEVTNGPGNHNRMANQNCGIFGPVKLLAIS